MKPLFVNKVAESIIELLVSFHAVRVTLAEHGLHALLLVPRPTLFIYSFHGISSKSGPSFVSVLRRPPLLPSLIALIICV